MIKVHRLALAVGLLGLSIAQSALPTKIALAQLIPIEIETQIELETLYQHRYKRIPLGELRTNTNIPATTTMHRMPEEKWWVGGIAIISNERQFQEFWGIVLRHNPNIDPYTVKDTPTPSSLGVDLNNELLIVFRTKAQPTTKINFKYLDLKLPESQENAPYYRLEFIFSSTGKISLEGNHPGIPVTKFLKVKKADLPKELVQLLDTRRSIYTQNRTESHVQQEESLAWTNHGNGFASTPLVFRLTSASLETCDTFERFGASIHYQLSYQLPLPSMISIRKRFKLLTSTGQIFWESQPTTANLHTGEYNKFSFYIDRLPRVRKFPSQLSVVIEIETPNTSFKITAPPYEVDLNDVPIVVPTTHNAQATSTQRRLVALPIKNSNVSSSDKCRKLPSDKPTPRVISQPRTPQPIRPIQVIRPIPIRPSQSSRPIRPIQGSKLNN